MRQYMEQDKNTIKKIVCNQCGRNLKVEDGIIKEGVFRGEARWGFFSEKDGEIHSVDLCEACYDRLIKGFSIPVEKEEQTELLQERI